ncbi:DUF721 domain-containing protein [Neptunicoccus cionae]|uniref:DUF721 domain-containing protein n=1 Tax=Neptunicoccus cionae TaxID=2035344 RepID=UPI002570A441|nr:DciA family protein [Amylibacter cionae]
MAAMKSKNSPSKPAFTRRKARGFLQTGGILGTQIRKASEKRGFSETRLLTHWAEIAGESVARIARPVKVGYTRQGMGATLTLLTTGANAPMVQMQLPQIKDRVNATYGYAAISRIHITQTSPTGFADKQADFYHDRPEKPPLSAEKKEVLARTVSDVSDGGLKAALAALGENILKKQKS